MYSKRSIVDKTPARKRVHQHIRHHYYRVMPDKKRHRVMIWVTFFAVSITVALQMLYPVSRAVPFATLGGGSVAWQTDVEISQAINAEFINKTISLHVDDQSVEYSLGEIGAEPATESMALRLTDYSFWQRFVPFSILWQTPRIDEYTITYSNMVLDQFVARQQKKFTQEPVNAGVAIEDGRLVAEDDRNGRRLDAGAMKESLLNAVVEYGSDVDVVIEPESVPADKQTEDIADVVSQLKSALARQVTIHVAGRSFKPNADQISKWLTLTETSSGATAVKLKKASVEKYVAELDKVVGSPAGQTNIELQNGIEISRTDGNIGSRIDSGPLLASIEAYILRGEGSANISASMVDVQPSVIYNRKYSATEAGLRAYVIDAAREQNANIVVEQLSNSYWKASANADVSTVSASTYKLYVALYLFDQMDKSSIKWNDSMLDTTVSGCFDRMTIASTNPCAMQWLSDWGRDNVNNFVWNHGFSRGTTFTDPEAVHTTAGDLAEYMVGLERGTLISGAHRDRLLSSLSSHPYTYGVPSGTAAKVYDKVGFLWDYVHDAAIVRHPRGTYVIAVMTQGRSYAAIAEITRQVEKILYP